VVIGARKVRIILDRGEKVRDRLIKTPAKEIRGADDVQGSASPARGAEAARQFGVPDRLVRLACPAAEAAALMYQPRSASVSGNEASDRSRPKLRNHGFAQYRRC